MKQTWHSIGRSVDAHFLIAHWGYLMYTRILYLFETFDILIMMIDFILIEASEAMIFRASLIISVCYIDIADLYWLIILHCLAHLLWFCHDCSDHLTCIHSLLYIIRLDMLIHLLVYYFDHLWACCLCITIHLIVVFSFILCVCIDDISEICLIVCCMTTLLCVIACCLSVWAAHLSPYL